MRGLTLTQTSADSLTLCFTGVSPSFLFQSAKRSGILLAGGSVSDSLPARESQAELGRHRATSEQWLIAKPPAPGTKALPRSSRGGRGISPAWPQEPEHLPNRAPAKTHLQMETLPYIRQGKCSKHPRHGRKRWDSLAGPSSTADNVPSSLQAPDSPVLHPPWFSLRLPANNLQEGQQWLINELILQSQEKHLHQEGTGSRKIKAEGFSSFLMCI